MVNDEIERAARLVLAGANSLGIDLTAERLSRLNLYCALLLDANRRFNLTALRTPDDVMRVLFLDSLTIVPALPSELKEASLPVMAVDVGTGAGIPGLVLAILFPHWSVLLIESVQKKARFVADTARTLDLAGVSVEAVRAEEIAARRAWRDRADLCMARAVAALPSLLELCGPLVKVGGVLALPRSGDVAGEIDAAAPAAAALALRSEGVRAVSPELGLGDRRFIALYRKVGPTPPGYPRRVGLATSRPIGSG